MITKAEYLRLSTLLPVLTPVVLIPLLLVADMAGLRIPASADFTASVTFSALFMFGVPYALAVGLVLVLTWKLSWKALATVALVAPLLVIAAMYPWFRLTGDPNAWKSTGYWVPWCLAVGYSYVALAFGGMWGLARTGRLSER